MKRLALIPARSGSTRITNKNILSIQGHPLIAYTIASAANSSLFDDIIVCTDSPLYAEIARYYGATVPGLRPKSVSGCYSPDRDWISWLFSLSPHFRSSEYSFILRPTSPFRCSETITRAWGEFAAGTYDTLRAVSFASEHPAKMWVKQGDAIVPLLPFHLNNVPWHSNQTSALFDVFIQNASLEIFTTATFLESGSITGSRILPFLSNELEGFDLNTAQDLLLLEKLTREHYNMLETIPQSPWKNP